MTVVILDNLSTHKRPRVAKALSERGCWFLFLPAFSPDPQHFALNLDHLSQPDFFEINAIDDTRWLRLKAKRFKRYANNINHLSLPEVKDFNALSDERCARYFVKRYKSLRDGLLKTHGPPAKHRCQNL